MAGAGRIVFGRRIQVIPERDSGYAAVRYEFRYLELRQYLPAK
jgi:hypothetical protein